MWRRAVRWLCFFVLWGWSASRAGEPDETSSAEEWYDAAVDFLQELTPAPVWEEYEPVGYEEWMEFFASLERVLQGDSYDVLADWLPYVRTALDSLKTIPAAAPYADWLAQRLDYFEVAESVVKTLPTPRPASPPPSPPRPSVRPPPQPPPRTIPPVPPEVQKKRNDAAHDLSVWKQRIRSRPAPAGAAELVPTLKRVFREEGMPEALVWLAEVESSFNPNARSPVGAAGLFQFMPATAERFGLSLRPTDQRMDPRSSARAASRYLRLLHQKFGDWPLAFAAYNAGEGRVSRLLKARSAASFAAIENDLPVETRMYVPKILATIEVREGVDARTLPAPAPAPRAFMNLFDVLAGSPSEPLLRACPQCERPGRDFHSFATRSTSGAPPRVF